MKRVSPFREADDTTKLTTSSLVPQWKQDDIMFTVLDLVKHSNPNKADYFLIKLKKSKDDSLIDDGIAILYGDLLCLSFCIEYSAKVKIIPKSPDTLSLEGQMYRSARKSFFKTKYSITTKFFMVEITKMTLLYFEKTKFSLNGCIEIFTEFIYTSTNNLLNNNKLKSIYELAEAFGFPLDYDDVDNIKSWLCGSLNVERRNMYKQNFRIFGDKSRLNPILKNELTKKLSFNLGQENSTLSPLAFDNVITSITKTWYPHLKFSFAKDFKFGDKIGNLTTTKIKLKAIYEQTLKNPMCFVKAEILNDKNIEEVNLNHNLEPIRDQYCTINRGDYTLHCINLMEWNPRFKSHNFPFKDSKLDVPFFISTNTFKNLLNSNIPEKITNRIIDVLTQFLNGLMKTNSDISYNLFTSNLNLDNSIGNNVVVEDILDEVLINLITEVLLTYEPSNIQISKVKDIKNVRDYTNWIKDLNPFIQNGSSVELTLLPPIIKTKFRSISNCFYYQTSEQFVIKNTIIHHLKGLYSRRNKTLTIDSNKSNNFDNSDENLTQDQIEIIKSVESFPVTIVIGGPGTGKTFVGNKLIEKFGISRVRLMSYTGSLISHLKKKLFKNIKTTNDNTIITRDVDNDIIMKAEEEEEEEEQEQGNNYIDQHSQSQSAHSCVIHMVHQKYIQKFKYKKYNYDDKDQNSDSDDNDVDSKVELVIIDEIPMFDNKSFAMALSIYSNTQKRLLLLGDGDQIGSIGQGNVFKELCSFFGEQVENDETKKLINVLNLKTNFRQTNQDLKEFTNLYKAGSCGHYFSYVKNNNVNTTNTPLLFLKLPDNIGSEERVLALENHINNLLTGSFRSLLNSSSSSIFLALTHKTKNLINNAVTKYKMGFNTIGNTSFRNHLQVKLPTYYVSQKVMISERNFVEPGNELYNGESYFVNEIFSVSVSKLNNGTKKGIQQLSKERLFKQIFINNKNECFGDPSYYNQIRENMVIHLTTTITTTTTTTDVINQKSRFVMLQFGLNNNINKITTPSYCFGRYAITVIKPENLVESWAITVNKSQGCEFDNVCFVVVDGEKEIKGFQSCHGLVAISRAKSHFVFIGNNENLLEKLAMKSDKDTNNINSNGSTISSYLSDLKYRLQDPDLPWNTTS